MRNKSVFLLLACVAGTIAAIGFSQLMQANGTGNEVQTVEIFVTAKAIDVGEEITADKIRLEQWPVDRVPEGASATLDDLQGKYAKQRFYTGEPVMPMKLMNDANGKSTKIPKGYSVVSMKADQANAVANLVRPGDRVDVMAYFTKSEVIPESMAKTILKGVRVFAVDGRTERDEGDEESNSSAKVVSLLIHKKDAEAWTYATELGRVRLTLGNPGEYAKAGDAMPDEANAAGQEFLSWLAEYQRAREERLAAERAAKLAAKDSGDTTPIASAPGEPAKRASGFRMLKMSQGVITEYEWIDGRLTPVVVSETTEDIEGSSDASGLPVDPDADELVRGESDEDEDYGYLNGQNSPFYQPPAGEDASPFTSTK
ncbi:MAG: Flp pilus assembly protein CpaB [Planctomycetota bacterium]